MEKRHAPRADVYSCAAWAAFPSLNSCVPSSTASVAFLAVGRGCDDCVFFSPGPAAALTRRLPRVLRPRKAGMPAGATVLVHGARCVTAGAVRLSWAPARGAASAKLQQELIACGASVTRHVLCLRKKRSREPPCPRALDGSPRGKLSLLPPRSRSLAGVHTTLIARSGRKPAEDN